MTWIKFFLQQHTLTITVMLLLLLMFFFSVDAEAQCAMCKGTTESNFNGGGSQAKGINAGVMYLFVTPYLLVGSIGFIWWWKNRKANEQNSEDIL